jgi:hypothetical protein
MRPEFLKKNPKPLSSGACARSVSHTLPISSSSHLVVCVCVCVRRCVCARACGCVCVCACACGDAFVDAFSPFGVDSATEHNAEIREATNRLLKVRVPPNRCQWRADGNSSGVWIRR